MDSKTLKKIIIDAVLAAVFGLFCFLTYEEDFFITNIGTLSFSLYKIFAIITMTGIVLLIKNIAVLVLSSLKVKDGAAKTVVTILRSTIRYIAAFLIICLALDILGVAVSTIVTTVSILTLIVGFSAESLIADVITGVFMLFEHQYNVGDIVEVGDFRGTVIEIGIRTTQIEDAGGNVKIVNNSNMKDILNRSNHVSKSVSDIQVSYETDIEELEKKLPKMLEGIQARNSSVMNSVPEYLGIQSLDASGVTLRFVVSVDEKNIYSGTRLLNKELLCEFKKANVEIPYPHLDVNLKK